MQGSALLVLNFNIFSQNIYVRNIMNITYTVSYKGFMSLLSKLFKAQNFFIFKAKQIQVLYQNYKG